MTFDEVRAGFPVLERLAYLNAGTFGPLARATVEAMEAQQRAELKGGRSGRAYYEDLRGRRARVRQKLAEELSVPAEHVALTASTTSGCNIVLAGLGLGPEDEVVTTDVEHFGLLGALHASGATVRVARIRDLPAARALDAILAETGGKTRLVAVSHVSWMTGHYLPVAELKEELSAPLLVDGAQAVGAVRVDASSFDFYATSGQKWLCGPDGTGALYVADPERLRVAAPTHFSQASHEDDGSFQPVAGAARFDSGSVPLPSLAGLEAALDAAPAWRFERARAMAERCRALLAERFEVVTEAGHATLVAFRPDGKAAEVAARLQSRGVVVRDIPRAGWIRVSCGYWTSDEDLERLLEALS